MIYWLLHYLRRRTGVGEPKPFINRIMPMPMSVCSPASPATADICCTLFSRRNVQEQHYLLRKRSHGYKLPEHSSSLNDSNFLTRMLYKDINRFDDICWHLLIFSFIYHIHVLLRFVNHLLNYYLLTYLLKRWTVSTVWRQERQPAGKNSHQIPKLGNSRGYPANPDLPGNEKCMCLRITETTQILRPSLGGFVDEFHLRWPTVTKRLQIIHPQQRETTCRLWDGLAQR